MSDDNSELEPPDPIPNSEVKRFSADGSLGFPHVRVGHRQALIIGPPRLLYGLGGFFLTYLIEQINDILVDLSKNGEILASDWPEDAPVSAVEMGLEERLKKIVLPAHLDLIDLGYIRQKLSNVTCRKFEIVGSTNTEMLKVADSQDINNLLYLAEYQHSGRGRRGRTWISPYARNLSISYGLETSLPFSSIGCLSLVIGLAVANTLRSIGIDMVRLKWPNDVLVNNRKLGGILVELSDKGSSRAVVVGLGLNIGISHKEQSIIDQPVIDLSSLGVELSRSHLVCLLVESMQLYLKNFLESGFKPLREEYEGFLVYRNQICRLQVGEKVIAEGVLRGVNEEGELEFHHGENLKSYSIGEISLKAVDNFS